MHLNNKSTISLAQPRKSLSTVLPDGLLVNRNWLSKKGFKRPLVDYYLRSGALEAVARGVYRRPGPTLKWQHVVYSMQEMGLSVHVGGSTALDHQGLVHYLPMGTETIHLYNLSKLPGWLHKVGVGTEFTTHHRTLFAEEANNHTYKTLPFGAWDWPLNYSTQERALLEYLDDVSDSVSFDRADKYMESATIFRPSVMMVLLQACKRIRTKRLFLWLAERHHHAWFDKLDTSLVDLGSGKRVIYKGGKLNAKYQITIPAEYANGGSTDGSTQPLF